MIFRKRDSEIEQWVLRALTMENLCASEICVEAHNGTIRLCGSVKDPASREAAERAAYRAPEVMSVNNCIQVKGCTALAQSSSKTRALAAPLRLNLMPAFLQGS